MDRNAEPKRDVPLWSETRWNGCWNGDDGVGLYLHAGRYRRDLDMWWVQVVAYLPGDELCVERFWGRNASDAGVRVGGLDLAMTDDGWTASFDGVGQLTTIGALARRAQGASAPMRPMRIDVEAKGRTPVWNMYAGGGDRHEFAGDTHIQQGYTTSGTVTVGDTEHRLDGIGFKDHSSGVRDFGQWHGHRFMLIVAEDWTCHAVVMYQPDGQPLPPWGAFFRDGQQAGITRFDLPKLADSAGGPVHGDVVIETDSGERLEFASELVHSLPTLMTVDNEYVNGIDWELDGDPIVLVEGNARLTAPDGSVAYCFHERSGMRSAVTLPGA